MGSGAAILKTFYRAAGQFVPTTQLAKLSRTPPEKIAIEAAELERLGYVIELHPHRGYRLIESPDRLMADDLEARLDAVEASLESVRDEWDSTLNRDKNVAPARAAKIIGSDILVFEETASTNDVCEQLMRSGGRDGLVVFAESQTHGRGRRGRVWTSPRGKGLWFSVLLRPQLPTPAAQRITVAASVAVALAMRETSGLNARIKWPNDVTVQGKKLAGILVETSTCIEQSTNKVDGSAPSGQGVILGIGINVNCQQDEFPPELAEIATSLQMATGKAQNRPALAAATLRALDQWYRAALTEFDTVTDEWARLSTTLGKQISVTVGTRRIEGCAQALDGDGALLVRKDNGHVERMLGGDLAHEL